MVPCRTNAAGDPLFEESVGGGNGKGDFCCRRRDPGDGGHFVEDLLEGEVFATQDVAATRLPDFKCGDGVGARDLSYVDEVESGVDVGRDFAVQKVDEDAAGGRGLGVVRSDGCGRVKDDDLLAVLRCGDSLLFGEKLGSLVVAHHIAECHGSVFVHDDSIRAEGHGGNRLDVDDAADPSFAGELEQIAVPSTLARYIASGSRIQRRR